MKRCTQCREEKDESQFGRLISSQDGLRWDCRACRSKGSRQTLDRVRGTVRACTICHGEFAVTNSLSYCKPCHSRKNAESHRRWKAANPEVAHLRKKASHLKANFGLTLEEYSALLDEQGGGCAICGTTKSERGKKLAVDHCHETGRIRGLLCSRCNHALGQVDDRTDLLLKAVDYLERSRTLSGV